MSAEPVVLDVGAANVEDRTRRRDRRVGWVGRALTFAAMLPIWVAVIRAGRSGLFPVSDAAMTVLRARDVFGGAFPLVGMPAAAATGDGLQAYFPGAWQLYVLALPTWLFGNVWGPLVAMGLLNSLWVLLACWLLFRLLTLREALVGVGFLALLLWSLGSGFVVTPVPMDMVLIPTALLVIVVWAVAVGDLVGLPVLALVANYLWLSHLTLVLTVPILVVCAVIGFVGWLRRQRSLSGVVGEHRRRDLRTSIGAAGVITAVMWLPTLVQQVTHSPGNLNVLVASSRTDRPSVESWPTALHYVTSVVARPPAWLRGSLEHPPFMRRPIGGTIDGLFTVFDLVTVVVIVSVLIALGFAAHRRDDRQGLWLLIVAGVGLGVGVVTAYLAPTYLGTPIGYVRALWPTAAFFWFAIVVNALRMVPRFSRGNWMSALAAGVIFVASVANLIPATFGYDSDHRTQQVVHAMNAEVLSQVDRGESVLVETKVDFSSHLYGAALELALAGAHVAYCVPAGQARSDSSRPQCPTDVARMLHVAVVENPVVSDGSKIIFSESLLAPADRRELGAMNVRIDAWLRRQATPTLTGEGARWLSVGAPKAVRKALNELVNSKAWTSPDLRQAPGFRGLVGYWYAAENHRSKPVFARSPLTPSQWRRWVDLTGRDQVLVVTDRPTR